MKKHVSVTTTDEQSTGRSIPQHACNNCGEQMLRELTSSQRLAPSCEICQLALLLIALQTADALLTYLGIQRFGHEAEGNPFIREMMVEFGTAEILTLIKVTAVLAIVLLVKRLQHDSPAARGLFFVTCFYVVAVLLPWSYFLFF